MVQIPFVSCLYARHQEFHVDAVLVPRGEDNRIIHRIIDSLYAMKTNNNTTNTKERKMKGNVSRAGKTL